MTRSKIRRKFLFVATLCLLVLFGCKEKNHNSRVESQKIERHYEIVHLAKNTISTRFSPPEGYTRNHVDEASFAHYLRSFKLLDATEKVHLFDGSLKGNQEAHAAILDIDVGRRDLQQCADAVMRLRAEYLWKNQRYDDIAFDFTNGWKFEYAKWRAGNKLEVNGNTTRWTPGTTPKDSYAEFRKYLNKVFIYAGTLSLSKEMQPKPLIDVEIGDVFIIGGSPGHAVLVVDVAIDSNNGNKAIMLAQSYMPAQQIHVLKNQQNPKASPWYLLSEIDSALYTPEWTFQISDLKGF